MSIQVTHIKPEFVDERGGIARIVDQDKHPIKAILRITAKAGTIRGNHYHKTEYLYTYMESGSCEYFIKDSKNPNAKVESTILGPGDMVFTKPGTIRAARFLEDSVMYHIGTASREHNEYEKDVVRVKII